MLQQAVCKVLFFFVHVHVVCGHGFFCVHVHVVCGTTKQHVVCCAQLVFVFQLYDVCCSQVAVIVVARGLIASSSDSTQTHHGSV